jgi:hypothetical protein
VAYCDFDAEIHAQFFTHHYIISPASSDYQEALQNTKNKNLLHGGFGTFNAHAAVPDNKRPFQYKPYDVSEWPFHTRPSEMVSYCLRCGLSDGHRAYSCKAETPNKHGRAFMDYRPPTSLHPF